MKHLGVQHLSWRRVADPASARRFVTERLVTFGAPPDVVQRLRLVVSELTSNALVNGIGDPRVMVEQGDDGWGVEVTGGWQPADHQLWDPLRWRVHLEQRTSGRGLGLVRALVDDVEVRAFGDDVQVECWIDTPLISR